MSVQLLPAYPVTNRQPNTLVRFVVRALLAGCLTLVTACGFGGPTPIPTLVPTLAPVPRPTAEPATAVAAWYLAAQATPEETVRIRADLTQHEVERINRVLTRRYPNLT